MKFYIFEKGKHMSKFFPISNILLDQDWSRKIHLRLENSISHSDSTNYEANWLLFISYYKYQSRNGSTSLVRLRNPTKTNYHYEINSVLVLCKIVVGDRINFFQLHLLTNPCTFVLSSIVRNSLTNLHGIVL